MLPEVNLAQRLLARRQLTPPVDVEALLREYADVEILEMPFEVDGICFDLKVPGRRPKVFVNKKGRSDRRVRFTLAHELGHILIPWHSGLIVDKLTTLDDLAHAEYWRLEGEANRFASELLVPSAWAAKVFANHSAPIEAVSRIYRRANVSYQMATLKMLRVLPPGFVYARLKDGFVISSGSSKMTYASPPAEGKKLANPEIYFKDAQTWSERISDIVYCWWFTGSKDTISETIGDRWKLALTAIVDDLGCSPEEATKFKSSINGMIAVANGKIKTGRDFEGIYAACYARLAGNSAKNDLLSEAMDHELFEEFLEAKVRALLD